MKLSNEGRLEEWVELLCIGILMGACIALQALVLT